MQQPLKPTGGVVVFDRNINKDLHLSAYAYIIVLYVYVLLMNAK